jgi:hypothetical protein
VLAAVDHCLWGVHLPIAPYARVRALAFGEGVLGEGVLPAEPIPVIDRKRQDDELRIVGELGE